MTGEPAKPIFGFLWPRRPAGPLDADARQSRWERVTPRGPWRLALLISFSLALVSLAAPAMVALVAAPSAYALALVILVLVPATALIARGWVAGCFVSDAGVKVATVLRTTYAPWQAIAEMSVADGSRWLGTPLRVRGQRLTLRLLHGTAETGLCTASPDLWLRPQAWAIARDRLQQWWLETRAA